MKTEDVTIFREEVYNNLTGAVLLVTPETAQTWSTGPVQGLN